MAYGSCDKCSNLSVCGLTVFSVDITTLELTSMKTVPSMPLCSFFIKVTHVWYLLQNESLNLRNEQIQFRRDVFKRIIAVIKLIGKCGLSNWRLDTKWLTSGGKI